MSPTSRREFLAAAGGTLAASAMANSELLAASERSARSALPATIPPHRAKTVDGVHAYTDRVSVCAGDLIRFRVSSSVPYELQLCRLGTDVDGPSRDEILHSFGQSPAATQPIHPGSYILVEKPLDDRTTPDGLTLEV